jgi:hypothetical protein
MKNDKILQSNAKPMPSVMEGGFREGWNEKLANFR